VTDGEVEIRYVLPTQPNSEHVRFCQLRKDYFGFDHRVGHGRSRTLRRVRPARLTARDPSRS
jgi:hypothetical protein